MPGTWWKRIHQVPGTWWVGALALVAVLVVGCGRTGLPVGGRGDGQSVDYGIYEAAVAHVCDGRGPAVSGLHALNLGDCEWLPSPEEWRAIWRLRHPGATDEVIDRLYAVACDPPPRLSALDLPVGGIEPTERELAMLEDNDGRPDVYWRRFYDLYPGACGFVAYSTAAVSDEGRLALIAVSRSSGALDGWSGSLLLRFEDGGWRVVEEYTDFVS